MNLLYILGLKSYYVLLFILSPFHKKAKLWINGRKNWYKKLKNATQEWDSCIWVHAASLGEFEQGRPVIEEIKKRKPNQKILLSFFSPSGYEMRKDYPLADYVCYIPIDSKTNAKKFISSLNLDAVLFIKYEFWRNFMFELQKNNIPVYLISSIFREDQIFFKPAGKWYRKVLFLFEHLFVQNEESLELLKSIGINNASRSGDTRFDRVYDLKQNHKPIEQAESFKDDRKIIIAGSTWPKDEDLLINFINQHSEYKYIIAAHEVSEKSTERITSKLNKSFALWTECSIEQLKNTEVLVVNTMGVLSKLYYYADLAYIGGGFGVGIHNTLEAATYGLPLVFGPNYRKFQEAKDLISIKGAISISNQAELNNSISELLSSSNLETAKESVENYVKTNIGVSSKIVDHILK